MIPAAGIAVAKVIVMHPYAVNVAHRGIMVIYNDPNDSKSAVRSLGACVKDVWDIFMNLGYAAWYRDSSYLVDSGRSVLNIPCHLADSVVYGFAAITTIKSIGDKWHGYREQGRSD